MNVLPRVTFGMIVLNGEPFMRYNLRALYPFAHEIIVAEGAAPAAANVATPDGHSTDGTLETVRRFQAEEDPEGKVILVTAEDEGHPNGFWPGEKDEQSQAYARRATGDYLWQVDSDEFYMPEDMTAVLQTLKADPTITAVSFPTITFWGGFDYVVDGWYLRRGAQIYHRLFRWGPAYRYVTHRPPTVHDREDRDLRSLRWLRGEELARQGLVMRHYSLLLPKQVVEKCEYYGTARWARRSKAQQWAQECFLELKRPFRVHNVYDYPSWLERFTGEHPPQIEAMRHDIAGRQIGVQLRRTNDIESLLGSPTYALRRSVVKTWDGVDLRMRLAWQRTSWRMRWFRQLPGRVWRKTRRLAGQYGMGSSS